MVFDAYQVKKLMDIMKLFLTGLFLLISAASFSQLTVSVENIRVDSGTVLIALYNSKKTFNNTGSMYREGRAKVKNEIAVFTFENLAEGDYAISLFQDINDNNMLDKTSFGIPHEPYGFSNNASGTFGPPPYKKARFRYNGRPMELSIKLN
jgi:uncharacterized protein (DUF2141 family)